MAKKGTYIDRKVTKEVFTVLMVHDDKLLALVWSLAKSPVSVCPPSPPHPQTPALNQPISGV